jgi:hypothetical protein
MAEQPSTAPPYSARLLALAQTRCQTASEYMVDAMSDAVSVKMAT